mmetsp:Transcript_13290/g.19880  ORF Transcript_13290/g.19880 Transcript_13290/m.19880 type:complete len:93 (+) Transcript_13290:378-656(+)
MDAKDLKFNSGQFDAVFDKGTMDSILCGPNSVKSAGVMLWNIHKVMKSKSVFFIITYGSPNSRISLFNSRRFQWDIKHEQIGSRHLYTLTKR